MTVTKQQQLEWLAKEWSTWNGSGDQVFVSKNDIGRFIYLSGNASHRITRTDWQHERDKMSSKPEVDNSWHERGEFPQIGCECEVRVSNDNWVKAFAVGLDIDGAMVVQFIDSAIPFGSCASPSYFRPLRTEREKAIENMARIIADHGGVVNDISLGALVDAGFKMVKP